MEDELVIIENCYSDDEDDFIPIDDNICECGHEFLISDQVMECPCCGNIKDYVHIQSQHSSSFTESSNKIYAKLSVGDTYKNKLILFSCYHQKQRAQLNNEFSHLKEEYPGLEDSILNKARIFYEMVIKEETNNRGDTKKGIQIACIYTVSYQENLPRTKKELSVIYDIEEKKISNGLNIVRNVCMNHDIQIKTHHELIPGYINRYLLELKIDNNNFIKNVAKNVMNKSSLHQNKNPECIAISIIFWYCKLSDIKIDLKDMSTLSYTSEKNILNFVESMNYIFKSKYTRSFRKLMKHCF